MNTRFRFSLALALVFATSCTSSMQPPPYMGVKKAGSGAVIEGTAAYRERIALPPSAEFEAVLQDVSRVDAAAMEIGRTVIAHAPSPPIRFRIAYDAAKIESGHSYAVRAVIRVDGKLWFSSHAAYPVLTRGAGNTVDILLKREAAHPE